MGVEQRLVRARQSPGAAVEVAAARRLPRKAGFISGPGAMTGFSTQLVIVSPACAANKQLATARRWQQHLAGKCRVRPSAWPDSLAPATRP
jgi:hypothetical protein